MGVRLEFRKMEFDFNLHLFKWEPSDVILTWYNLRFLSNSGGKAMALQLYVWNGKSGERIQENYITGAANSISIEKLIRQTQKDR